MTVRRRPASDVADVKLTMTSSCFQIELDLIEDTRVSTGNIPDIDNSVGCDMDGLFLALNNGRVSDNLVRELHALYWVPHAKDRRSLK